MQPNTSPNTAFINKKFASHEAIAFGGAGIDIDFLTIKIFADYCCRYLSKYYNRAKADKYVDINQLLSDCSLVNK